MRLYFRNEAVHWAQWAGIITMELLQEVV